MLLRARWSEQIAVATVCQTWRCGRCGNKRKQYAALRAEHGSISLAWPGPLSLITLTYRMTASSDLVDAEFALNDFRRWVQLLRRRTKRPFRWFRVPEVTRRGQTHWHVISGDLLGERHQAERVVRDCWALATRREGKVINYVVDVSETTPARSAAYVSKYLVKSQLNFAPLSQRGFTRRWATSRNWSKPEKIQLWGTVHDTWIHHEWVNTRVAHQEVAQGRRTAINSRLALRVGDPLVLALQNRTAKRVLASRYKRILGEQP